jgi:hypothetical protein
MITQKEEQVALFIEQVLKANCPYDTGNLFDSIRRVYDGDNIYVAIGGELAPYAVSTNVKWANGTNPNEGWVINALESVRNQVIQIFHGEIDKQEYNELMGKYEGLIQDRYADMLTRKDEELKALGG